MTLLSNSRVASLSFATNSGHREWTIKTDDTRTFMADEVCLALPAYLSAQLLQPLHDQLANELNSIDYASSITINFGFRHEDVGHPLNGFGFVVPTVEHRAIMACTFSSVKFDGRAPEDQVLLRVFAGGALQPEIYDLADDEILSSALRDLSELLDIKGKPTLVELARWKRSMPQYHVGHLEKVARIAELV